MPPYASSSLILSSRLSSCLRRTLRATDARRIRRQQTSIRGVSTTAKTSASLDGSFTNGKQSLDDRHGLRKTRHVLISAARLQRKEISSQGLTLGPLVEACDALSASQVERGVSVTVYGEEDTAVQNLVTALLDDPLSSGPSWRSKLYQRWSIEGEKKSGLRFQSTRTDFNDKDAVILSSPFFSRFSSSIALQELRSSASPPETASHLLRSDIPILVVSPLHTPPPYLLSAFSSNPHALVVVDGAFDTSSPSADAFRSQIADRYGVDQKQVFLVDTTRALRGATVLSTDPSSASAVQSFQSDTLASGIPSLLRALSGTVSQHGADRLRDDTENTVSKYAVASVKNVIHSAKEETREVRSRSSALQEEALEARERAEVEILGGDSDVAVQGEQGRVSRGIENVRTDLKPVLDGLTWYRLPFVVDDVSVRVDRAVEQAFAKEFENELIFHTGRLSSLQTHFVSRTNSLLSSLPPAFRSPLLRNTLAQITSSPSFPITPFSPAPNSTAAFPNSHSAPAPPALLTPLRTRTAQLAHATRSLHLSAQRLLLFTFTNTSLSSLSSALLYVHFSVDASTSIGFGALGTLAGLRWAVGRWAKARERWFGAFGRVGEGLERDMSGALGAVLDSQVCVVPNEACKGLQRLVERREKEIGEVEDEAEELEASLGSRISDRQGNVVGGDGTDGGKSEKTS